MNWKTIVVFLCVVAFFAPQDVDAQGTCKSNAPKNACGSCDTEGECGGTRRTSYCRAEVPKACEQRRTEACAEAQATKAGLLRTLLGWEDKPVVIEGEDSFFLTSTEQAFLYRLRFDPDGDNTFHLVVYRPTANEAKKVTHLTWMSGTTVIGDGPFNEKSKTCGVKVMDLDRDGISELEMICESEGVHRKTMMVAHVSVMPNRNVRMSALYGYRVADNASGSCRGRPNYCSMEVELTYEDVGGGRGGSLDGIPDLHVNVTETRSDGEPVSQTTIFWFDGGFFRRFQGQSPVVTDRSP